MKPQDILNILDDIEYGWIDNEGKKHLKIEPTLFYTSYVLQSPKEVLNNKLGVCWDQVELERLYFSKENIDFKTLAIIYIDNKNMPNHTFLIYNQNSKTYWFEHAFNKFKGIHEYDNEEDAILDIKNKFIIEELKNDYDKDNLFLYEYSKPDYKISCETFYKHFMNSKDVSNKLKEQ